MVKKEKLPHFCGSQLKLGLILLSMELGNIFIKQRIALIIQGILRITTDLSILGKTLRFLVFLDSVFSIGAEDAINRSTQITKIN